MLFEVMPHTIKTRIRWVVANEPIGKEVAIGFFENF